MAALKQSANSSSKGQFRPKALEPPRIGVSDVDYNVYVTNYRFYIESLAALRNEFWSDVAKPQVRTFEKRKVWHFRTKEGFEGYSPIAIEPSEKRSVMPTEALDIVKSEKTSMVKTPVPAKEPTPEQLKARKDIKKAARRRQRQNRRMRDARQAVTFSSNLVQVAKNNETLAKSRYTFGTTGVSPHSVVLPGRKKKKSGTDPAGKGKGSGGAPPPPRPQGPPGGAPPDSKDDKGPSDDPGKGRKPNRKERRRAKYGPPKPEQGGGLTEGSESKGSEPGVKKAGLPITALGASLLKESRPAAKYSASPKQGDIGGALKQELMKGTLDESAETMFEVSRLDRLSASEARFSALPSGLNPAAAAALRDREDRKERRSGRGPSTFTSTGLGLR